MTAKLTEYFQTARRIVFLTGAGMSTESGIPDFRSSAGLYRSGVDERVFEIDAFRREPNLFYGFARAFLETFRNARPNAGHHAIAALEKIAGKSVQVVTQNIDTLHQEAGSSRVHPVHGTLAASHCRVCGARVKTETLWASIAAGDIPRHAGCGGVFKPDIVFFGELLPADVVAAAQQAIAKANLLVVAGTSLQVYPAAGLPDSRGPDCRLVIINHMPTHLDSIADLRIAAGIGATLAAAIAKMS